MRDQRDMTSVRVLKLEDLNIEVSRQDMDVCNCGNCVNIEPLQNQRNNSVFKRESTQ
jgi:hypothetical protein